MSAMADPFLEARSVADVARQMNASYGAALPTDLPPGTVLGTLWAMAVVVARAPAPGVLYRATASVRYRFAGGLEGTLWIEIHDGGAPVPRAVQET